MKSHIVIFSLFLLIVLSLVALQGCTLIGLVVGGSIDKASPDSIKVPGWQIDTIKPGSDIVLLLRNGSRVAGTYSCINQLSEEEYYQLFNQNRTNWESCINLPAPKDSITIITKKSQRHNCVLVGYDYKCIWIRIKRHVERVSDQTINAIECKGKAPDVKDLWNCILEKQIPYISVIVLGSDAKQISVNLSDVHHVEFFAGHKYGWLIGLAVGVIIDIIVYPLLNKPMLPWPQKD